MRKKMTKLFLAIILLLSLIVQMTPPAVFANDNENTQQAAPEGDQQAAPEGDQQAAPEGDQQAAPEGDQQAAPEGDQQAAPEGDQQAAPEGDQQAAPEGDQQAAPKDDEQAAPEGDQQAAPKDDEQAAPKGDQQVGSLNSLRSAPANQPKSGSPPEVYCYVSFIYDGQTLKTKMVSQGGTVDATGVPLNITEPGKVFSHWSSEVGGAAFDFNTPINEDTTLYVVTKDAWIVAFDSNGGSAVLPIYVIGGNTIGTLPVPERAGYNFKHWSLTEGGPAIPANYTVTANITLYAVWESSSSTSYKVIYWQENAEDDEYTFKEIVYKTGTTGANATYDSKSYTGFHFGHADDTTISGNGDTVVNVYYDRNVYTFTIEYRTGSGWSATWHTYSTTQLKYGQSTATQYNAAVTAYPHYSWYVSRTSNTAYSEAPCMPNANLTVHGRYSGSSYQYTIGYYEQGTDVQIKEPFSFYSGSGSLSFTDEDGIDIPGFTVTPLSQWDRLRPGQVSKIYYTRNNYTLTFNKNNGDTALVISNIPFDSDISDKDTTGLNENSTFVQGGVKYYFAGWYNNSACAGEPYSMAGKKMPAHNLALYAKWIPETYTVTFYNTLNTGDGTFNTEEVIPLNTVPQPANHPPGEEFIGWYWYIGDYFVQFDFSMPIFGNFELFPVYANQTANVTYVANSDSATGTVPADNMIYLIGAEARVKSPTNLTNTGYFFNGWNAKSDGTGTSYQPGELASVPSGGLTLYAQWQKCTPVTFTGESDSRPYNGSEQSLTSITPSGLKPGHSYTGLSYEAKGTNVGTYDGEFSGTVKIKDTNNKDVTHQYTISYDPGTLTITANTEDLTIAATGYNGTYDAANHNGVTSATASLADAVITYSLSENGTYTSAIPQVRNVTAGTVIW
ncbi:MAG: hypothetical protein GX217_05825, partial [Clostridiaceae bacterium]|nr:hypothetical protein [Clostridiaceae bacterium]